MTTNSENVQAALNTLIQYPIQLDNAGKASAEVTLGPWKVSVSCSYGSSCCEKHASYHIDESLSSNVLQAILGQAEQHAKTFFQSFSSVHGWMMSLPKFSRTFQSSTTQILAILAQVQAGGSITAAQRVELSKLYDAIAAGLSSSKMSIEIGTNSMKNFNNQLQSIQTSIDNAKRDLTQANNNAVQNLRQFIAHQPCGQSEARDQLNYWISVNSSAVASVQQTFTNLGSDTQAAVNAFELLLGTVTDFELQIANIQNILAKASGAQLSQFMTQLNVQSATALFQDLAQQAEKSLSGMLSNRLTDIMNRAV